MSIRCLLIEDDRRLAALLTEYLGQNEIQVTVAPDGEAGLREARSAAPDIVLLDLMLPGIDGLDVCRRLRSRTETAAIPVLMITAKGEDVDKIVGLELGADDYLAKPFNPRELLARIRAVLRRHVAPAVHFRSGELDIDFGAREVTVAGRRVALTHTEFELLSVLAHAPGRVLTREQLFDALRGEDFDSFDRVIDVHVSKLRQKLEDNPKEPRYIKTVRGSGYLLTRS